MVGRHTLTALQEFGMDTAGSGGYWGAWQHQTVFRGGHSLWLYVPDLAGPVGGYDLAAGAEITDNDSALTVLRSHAADPADPPSHLAQYVKLGDSPLDGLAFGYMRTEGTGAPAERALNTSLLILSPSEKVYPVAVDFTRFPLKSGIPTVAAGSSFSTSFWEAAYPMGANPAYTVNVVFEDDGKVYRVIDCHASVSRGWLAMPPELAGRRVSVIRKSGSFTLHGDEIVTPKGLQFSVSNGWGSAIPEIE